MTNYLVGANVATIDLLNGKLKQGDVVQLARGGSGTTKNGLSLQKGVKLVPTGVGPLYKLVCTSTEKDGVLRVGAGDDGVIVGGCRIEGGYQGVSVSAADQFVRSVLIQDLEVYEPSGYGVYLAGKPGHNIDVTINRVSVEMLTKGEHCLRVYGAKNLKITNSKFKHRAPYDGGSLAIKAAVNDSDPQHVVMLDGVETDGAPPTPGPNPSDQPEYKLVGEWRNFKFQNRRFMSFDRVNLVLRKGEIHCEKGTAMAFRSTIESLYFEDVKITGDPHEKPWNGDNSHVKFGAGVTWNGKAVT